MSDGGNNYSIIPIGAGGVPQYPSDFNGGVTATQGSSVLVNRGCIVEMIRPLPGNPGGAIAVDLRLHDSTLVETLTIDQSLAGARQTGFTFGPSGVRLPQGWRIVLATTHGVTVYWRPI